MKDDSIEGIYDTLKQCALVSKSAGGIGVAVSCIRATGSYIAGVSFCCVAKNMWARGIQVHKQPGLWLREHLRECGRPGSLLITSWLCNFE